MAVYSTHTAFDCVKPGLNDWLIEGCFPGVKQVTPCEPSKSNVHFFTSSKVASEINHDSKIRKFKMVFLRPGRLSKDDLCFVKLSLV